VTGRESFQALKISRRIAVIALSLAGLAGFGSRSARSQESAQVRIQLDQQSLNAIPGDERTGLEGKEDTSAAAEDLKKRSPPGKAIPIIYLIVGVLSIPSVWAAIQEMLRRHEYGGVVIDARTIPANIHHDPSVQADLVMVIHADGSTETVRSTLATEDFLKAILISHGG